MGWGVRRCRAAFCSGCSNVRVVSCGSSGIRSALMTLPGSRRGLLNGFHKWQRWVTVGHSLGGVLLRAALNDLPPATRRASHLFLLGSPVRAARLAELLRNNPVYKIVTRDCGRLLGSAERMAEIGSVAVPTTVVVGVRGLPWPKDPFEGEPNDGVVARSEVCADWAGEEVHVPVGHTFLPSSRRVAKLILERIRVPAESSAR